MYIVKAVRVGKGNLRSIMNKLRAWYAIKKLYSSNGKNRIVYYLVADEESLNIFTKVMEANGYKISRIERLENIPWYLKEVTEKLMKHAKEVSLKRKCLELLKPVFRGEASVKEIAEKHGINYNKLLRIKNRLSKSILIEFLPRIEVDELLRHAVRVGLVPLTKTIYYSGSFISKTSSYAEVLSKLEGTPYSEFNRKLKEALARRYGLEARKALTALRNSEAYHRAIAESKIIELKDKLDFDYKIYTP